MICIKLRESEIKPGAGKRFEFNCDYCKGCRMCVPGVPVRGDADGA